MQKIILTIILLFLAIGGYAQDQTVNGNIITTGSVYVGENVSSKWGEGARLYLRGTDSSADPIWIAKYTPRYEITDLRVNVGDGLVGEDRFIVGTTQWDTKEFHEFFIVRMDGNVGIGVAQPKSKLDVNGSIRAKEVKIEATGWSDFVFAEDYKLPRLTEVETHIKEHKHLPDIPSEKEVIEEGVNVVEMQAKLLQKIEELTLYVIEQNKRIEALEKENKNLKKDEL